MTADTTGTGSGSAWDGFARGRAAPLALIAVAFAFQVPIFDRWFSFMDEGHILVYADIISQGGELYRDATVYPLPGSFYLLAWAFRLFGPSNLVARWILVVEFSLLVGLVFLLLRRIVPPGWAVAGALWMLPYRIWAFPHWHMYSYSSTALLLLFSALLGVVRFTEVGDRRWLLFAGLLFGLGVACKQDYAAAALVAIILVLFVAARTAPASGPSFGRLFGWFIAPAAAVGLATAAHFLRQGLLGDLIRFTVLNHLIGMASYEYPTFPPLLPIVGQDPFLRSSAGQSAYMPAIVNTLDLARVLESSWFRETALYDLALKLYYFAPYPVAVFGAARLWARRRSLRDPSGRPAALAELALWGFGSTLIGLVTLNRPQDYVHLVVLYWPLLCLGVVYLQALVQGRRAVALALVAVGAAPAALALVYTGSLAWRLRTQHSAPVACERSGLYVTPEQARLLEGLVDYIRAHTDPGEPVAIMPYFPILHFYAERPGPHRSSYIVWPFPEIPDREQRIIDALEATHTRVLIYNLNEFLVFEDMAHYAPQLFAYLVDHFEIDRVFSYEWLGYRIGAALRVDRAAAGRPLRPSEIDGASLRIESRYLPPLPVPPEAHAEYFSETLWPFRPVVAIRPSRLGRTALSLPAEFPEGARLQTAITVHPSRWDHDASTTFEIAIRDGERRRVLYERTLHPAGDFADRGWFEVDLSLAGWTGRPVRLELSAETDRPVGEDLLAAAFAVPRVVP